MLKPRSLGQFMTVTAPQSTQFNVADITVTSLDRKWYQNKWLWIGGAALVATALVVRKS